MCVCVCVCVLGGGGVLCVRVGVLSVHMPVCDWEGGRKREIVVFFL